MRTVTLLILFSLFSFVCYSQDSEEKSSKFGSSIFLPSLELGYMANNGDVLSGGVIVKTSLEYRLRNNNDFFIRLNYDAVDAGYELSQTIFTNVLEGKARFSDLLGGFGYRLGDKKLRGFVMAQAGTRMYNFPVIEQTANSFIVKSEAHEVLLTRFTLGAEYYFDEKSAFTLEAVQNNVGYKRHFWKEHTGSWGIVAGFITSLF